MKKRIILTAYLIHRYTTVRLPQFLRCVGPHLLGGSEKARGQHIFCVPVGYICIPSCGPRVGKAQNLFLEWAQKFLKPSRMGVPESL